MFLKTYIGALVALGFLVFSSVSLACACKTLPGDELLETQLYFVGVVEFEKVTPLGPTDEYFQSPETDVHARALKVFVGEPVDMIEFRGLVSFRERHGDAYSEPHSHAVSCSSVYHKDHSGIIVLRRTDAGTWQPTLGCEFSSIIRHLESIHGEKFWQ